MWTPTIRAQHSRARLRYQTDLTDSEWAVIAPHLPPDRATGRPRAWPMREIINAIFHVMHAGCPWRLIPTDLPPWGTVYRWFAELRDTRRFETINHYLVMKDRERVGREASPSAAIIDSQSVKTTESGGPRGYDAGKTIKGRKRHALVDTDGRGQGDLRQMQGHSGGVTERQSIIALPAKGPELPSVENISQVMPDNWLSNRVFTSHDTIVDHRCQAWHTLMDQPWHIMTISRRT